MSEKVVTDIMIIGSGFAGSVLAMTLRKSGYKVISIEKSEHPRFTIGESSTPIADMILRDLSDEYGLPVLKNISRYGKWQEHYPGVLCGLKRGFSYYSHQPHTAYSGDSMHHHELLVAASTNDTNSDTNWYRSDTDHFLAKEAEKEGATLFERSEIVRLKRNQARNKWDAVVKKENQTLKVQSDWILDCTGSPWFSGKFFGTESSASDFKTHTSALFSHFQNIPTWLGCLANNNCFIKDYPYNPDHSALHQIIEEGWLWMLRFNNGLLSSGLVFDHHTKNNPEIRQETGAAVWKDTMDKYPSLKQLFANASFAPEPGKLIATGRLQRKLNRVFGDGWIALPHTAGFVDPMHSTGIAHTLTGVERILSFFNQNEEPSDFQKFGETYQKNLFSELELVDTLVSLCYKTRRHFKLFHASVMLYFITTLHYESRRLGGKKPKSFLSADHAELRRIVTESAEEIHLCLKKGSEPSDIESTLHRIREKIAPFNTAGLLDPHKKNIYSHTAVMFE